MKTIFHDKESGIKLEVEGTFANSKAQLVDNEGNVTTELEGSYSEILEMISQLSGINEQEKEEPQEVCEDVAEDEENITFVSLEKLEKRNQDTPSFEIGETVEVKEGKAHSGAVGYAILVDIKEDEIILQGFNKHGEFLDSWHNNIENIKKVK